MDARIMVCSLNLKSAFSSPPVYRLGDGGQNARHRPKRAPVPGAERCETAAAQRPRHAGGASHARLVRGASACLLLSAKKEVRHRYPRSSSERTAPTTGSDASSIVGRDIPRRLLRTLRSRRFPAIGKGLRIGNPDKSERVMLARGTP
jgi:hypothetical protein